MLPQLSQRQITAGPKYPYNFKAFLNVYLSLATFILSSFLLDLTLSSRAMQFIPLLPVGTFHILEHYYHVCYWPCPL